MTLFDGKVTLVTGGSSGLGRAIVERFLADGAKVASMQSSAEGTKAIHEETGPEVLGVQGDVRIFADNVRAVQGAVDRFGQLDVFIGNAAIWDFSMSLEDLPADGVEAACEEMFGVNVTGCLLGLKAALPELRKTKGSAVLTVSNSGFYPGGGGPIYTASKHALVGLIRQVAMEVAPEVRVNGVAPGGMPTQLRGPASLGMENQRVEREVLQEIFEDNAPLAFLPEPGDYAGAYVWLASAENSKATTGTVVNCDVGLGVRPLVG
ncbi:MAG: 3-(cis-5,6-dihydroxycyclohexa-1,3-dien-1-yl)propanoate dehydrogenase [Gemmatimonas sp.]|nr:3-(cis-5,6-dihydroxycyclohexa-1,3-dien-1-yl)propanoate dehydrogenase [Gemmatimonas sp.]